jgi:hypothetical protein
VMKKWTQWGRKSLGLSELLWNPESDTPDGWAFSDNSQNCTFARLDISNRDIFSLKLQTHSQQKECLFHSIFWKSVWYYIKSKDKWCEGLIELYRFKRWHIGKEV